MSVPVYTQFSRNRSEATEATAAYQAADKLGLKSRRVNDWELLNRKRRNRRAVYPFEDVFRDELDDVEDAGFYEIPEPDDEHHLARLVYLLVAIMAGTLCLFIGSIALS